uniref:Homeobox domain-containing protein n=1 Tax=Meloidogyne incognita TaxID=6306 RepID=A0A914NC23_MELIC
MGKRKIGVCKDIQHSWIQHSVSADFKFQNSPALIYKDYLWGYCGFWSLMLQSLIFRILKIWIFEINKRIFGSTKNSSSTIIFKEIKQQTKRINENNEESINNISELNTNNLFNNSCVDSIELDEWRHSSAAGSVLRSRSFLSDQQLRILAEQFRRNSLPSKYELSSLAEKIGVNKRVVQVWFQNMRAKVVKFYFEKILGNGRAFNADQGHGHGFWCLWG